jgi:hypothetical protein
MSRVPPIQDECARLLELLRTKCPGVVPPAPLRAGSLSSPVIVPAAQALPLFPSAAASAAGIDPFSTAAPPSGVLWREGDRELLIYPSKVTARFATGVIAVTIPVACDQTGDSEVHVSFAVGDPQQPAGLIAATNSRPSGTAVIIDAWSDALIAYAWHVVLEVVTQIAGAAGRDVDGSRLVPISLAASADGLVVLPMARHTFERARG